MKAFQLFNKMLYLYISGKVLPGVAALSDA